MSGTDTLYGPKTTGARNCPLDSRKARQATDITATIAERPAVCAAGRVMARFGELDARDHAAATPGELAMFAGHHIPAPTAEEAAAGKPATDRRSPPVQDGTEP